MNEPERMRLSDYPWCEVHESVDTNRDGYCIRYGTAHPSIRAKMEPCRIEGSKSGEEFGGISHL